MAARDLDNFHNTLGMTKSIIAVLLHMRSNGRLDAPGECFRVLGRTSEAEREFKIALSINPDHYSAEFNLGISTRARDVSVLLFAYLRWPGLTYQQMNKWDRAIERYEAAQALARLHPSAVDRKTMLECKIRLHS